MMMMMMMMMMVKMMMITEASSQLSHNHHLPHTRLMAQFLRSTRVRYFPQCTLVLLHDTLRTSSERGHQDEVTALHDLILHQEAQTPHLVFELDENLTQYLRDMDLNRVSLCPVYVYVSEDINSVMVLFSNTDKDWDKYFMSRIHIVFIMHDLGVSEEEFLNTAEVNTMTNLILVRRSGNATNSPSLHVQTNSPYDTPKLRSLMTYRGEEENSGKKEDREKNAEAAKEGRKKTTEVKRETEQGTENGRKWKEKEDTVTKGKEEKKTAKINEDIEKWTQNKGGIDTLNLVRDKLNDMHGFEMKVVTFHFPPRIFMIEQEGTDYQLYGVDIEVVRALSQALNFRLSFTRPSDGEMWGWEQDNGTWTGLMGDLQERRADLGVADLYIMEQYFSIIDMSVEYDIEYLCFVNPVPGPLPQWMAVTLPFLPETWIAILLSVVAGMFVFSLIARVSWHKNNNMMKQNKESFRHNTEENNGYKNEHTNSHSDEGRNLEGKIFERGIRLGGENLSKAWYQKSEVWFQKSSNTCLLLYGCVVNTAWVRVPTSSHLRVFVLLWSLAFLIIAVAYKGSLVSHLTVPMQQQPINTHKQLYEKGVTVGSIGFTLKRVMEKNADRYVRLLAERYTHIPSTSEGLKRTVEGTYSFLESRGFLDYIITVDHTDRRGKASLHVMREYIAPFGIGLAYPKYVPYIGTFNTVIRRLTEAGLAKKYMTDIILKSKLEKSGKNEAQDSSVGDSQGDDMMVRALTLQDLQGCYIILGLGYVLSLIVLIFELIIKLAWHGCSWL